MPALQLNSDFMFYLASYPANKVSDGNEVELYGNQLPSLNKISQELGVSVATLREQLEVARAIGLVEVKPRTGIRRLPFTFLPAVRQSLAYALAVEPVNFFSFSDLRNHIEAAYWYEATRLLTEEDLGILERILFTARKKLNGHPVQIPHEEHKQLHLIIFRKLGNPFVTGLLEAYWEAYEAVELNLFADYEYLCKVWSYHQEMVEAIRAGDFQRGFIALESHREMLFQRLDSGTPMQLEKKEF